MLVPNPIRVAMALEFCDLIRTDPKTAEVYLWTLYRACIAAADEHGDDELAFHICDVFDALLALVEEDRPPGRRPS